jgi:hypothetical protein
VVNSLSWQEWWLVANISGGQRVVSTYILVLYSTVSPYIMYRASCLCCSGHISCAPTHPWSLLLPATALPLFTDSISLSLSPLPSPPLPSLDHRPFRTRVLAPSTSHGTPYPGSPRYEINVICDIPSPEPPTGKTSTGCSSRKDAGRWGNTTSTSVAIRYITPSSPKGPALALPPGCLSLFCLGDGILISRASWCWIEDERSRCDRLHPRPSLHLRPDRRFSVFCSGWAFTSRRTRIDEPSGTQTLRCGKQTAIALTLLVGETTKGCSNHNQLLFHPSLHME